MAIQTLPEFAEAIRVAPLLDGGQLDILTRELAPAASDPRALAREVVRRGWATVYQVNQVLLGRGHELVLGQYLLLERLGEGGMGQVFKARHRKMNRIAALKVMRRDKLGSSEAVRRFFREVQAAATLDHPNIVSAYDADEADGTYFFAMEYVEGEDLGQLVKRKGALKPGRACEYMRQAALGLQHAFEKGLVHRDIKPSNIIVRRGASQSEGGPLVKLLDLGLARATGAVADEASLTQIHSVLGTPDFIAPEQARSSRDADIRSDLYSLGCTFYYILTGQVPFPAESPMEKLLKHYLEEPPHVEALRPDVPRGIARLVRKLMAKAPEDRPQTPWEVAAVLGTMVASQSPTAVPLAIPVGPAGPDKLAEPPPPDDLPAEETLPDVGLEFATSDSVIIQAAKSRHSIGERTRRQRLVTFAVLGAAIGLMTAFIGLLLRYALQ
jgi:serine/threonine-protein kinase